jgi:pyrimidine operon attenuation protein/uracil phosphoribosyltransferase
MKTIAHEDEIQQFLSRMSDTLARTPRDGEVIVGIHRGGVWIAEALRQNLQIKEPLGELNIAFYRDDFSQIGMHPSVQPSKLPFDVDDRHIILVDDVLYTGRTIRAALNELFDYGRPASIRLAVLVDRGERELPIQPDVVGTTLSLPKGQHVKLTGPSPLTLVTQKAA